MDLLSRQPLNMGFDSYCDHYIVSMINKRWIIAATLAYIEYLSTQEKVIKVNI